MANQIIIDIGAAANDGTGDPLRTAFNYVNENFTSIWNTGVANSNVSFSGNRILTLNTNGNLVLAPNGTGKVQANVDIVPNANNTHSLGSPTLRWNTVYAQNLDVGGNTVFNNLTVDGNLTVEGDIIQIGNIVTDSKTIQLANTAGTDAAANGSGITVGATDDIATLLYNSANNVWTTNIGVSATGNIQGQYFVGNGALLTGITSYGNANVAAYLSNTTIPISTTGNITGNLLTGTALNINDGTNFWSINGQTIAGPGGSTLTSDGTSKDLSLGSGADGYLSLTSLFANSSVAVQWELEHTQARLFVNNGVDREWVFDDDGVTTVPGNIVPVTSNVYSLGSATNQWADLWVSNSTIYMNSVPITLGAGNVLTVNGNAVLQNNSNSTISTTGNITSGNVLTGGVVSATGNVTGNYFIGNGSQLTGLSTSSISNGNSNVAIATANGNVTITSAGTETWTFGSNGTTTLPNYTLLNPVDEDFTILVQDADDDGFALKLEVDDGAGNTLAQTQLTRDDFGITTDFTGAGHNWTFDNTGRLNLPGNIALTPTGGNASFYAVDNGNTGSVELKTISYAGDLLGSNIRVTQSNATISTSNAAHTWTFDNTGNLTAPGVITANTFVSNAFNVVTAGNLSITSQYGLGVTGTILENGGTLELIGNGTGAGTTGCVIVGWNSSYGTAGNVAQMYFNPADSTGNIVVTTGNTAGTSYAWTFDKTGTLTAPGNVSAVGNITGAYILGNGSQLTGLPATYGNANVATFLAAYGSNTITTTGNVTVGNLISSTGIVGNIELIMGNVANASATRTRILSDGAFSYIQTGNGTAGTTGNIVFSPYQSPTQRVVIDTASGNLTAAGNVTAQNFTGNINITGNVQGTSSNVTLVAGAYSWTFDNTGNTQGNLSLTGANITINNAPGGNEGAEIQWALPSAANTVLTTSLVQDVFQNGMRFFEAGGNNRGLYMDLGNVPNGSTTAVGYRDIPQVSFAGNTTIATTDAGRHYYSTQSTSYTLTIANNASQGFQVGAAITVINQGTGNIIVAQGSGVTLYLAGNATSGNRTVATFGMATLIKVATNTWFINGTGVS